MSHMHYLPLAPGFFAILVGLFFIVLILRSVRYAYESLGVSSNTAIFLLFATLIGSFFNIPITELPPERAISHHVVDFFGMRYALPVVSHSRGTIVAVNVGGAIIPTLTSIYLLIKRELWVKGVLATVIVALVIHWMADRGADIYASRGDRHRRNDTLTRRLGAACLYCWQPRHADRRRSHQPRQGPRLGCTSCINRWRWNFDGIFLTGILAVLLASRYARPRALQAGRH
jgi:Protein of unknown function (DUF1614)